MTGKAKGRFICFFKQMNRLHMAAIDEAARQIEFGQVVVKTLNELVAMENE